MKKEPKITYGHKTIVLRNSNEEITFAEVSCMTVGEMTDRQLRNAISKAVFNWRTKTEEGRKAWEASSEDFNIGDLVDYVEYGVEEELEKELEAEGVEDLHIETHSFEAYRPTPWSYDDVLGEEE